MKSNSSSRPAISVPLSRQLVGSFNESPTENIFSNKGTTATAAFRYEQRENLNL